MPWTSKGRLSGHLEPLAEDYEQSMKDASMNFRLDQLVRSDPGRNRASATNRKRR